MSYHKCIFEMIHSPRNTSSPFISLGAIEFRCLCGGKVFLRLIETRVDIAAQDNTLNLLLPRDVCIPLFGTVT